jgi:O-antigen/teichoic acid export membrane protein
MKLKQLIQSSIIWRGLYFVTLFGVNMMLSRMLQAEQAGVVFYLTTILGFLFIILNFSIDTSVTYFNASNTISTHKLLNFGLLWTAIVAILIYMLVPYLWQIFPIGTIDQIEKNRFAFFYLVGLMLTYNQTSLFFSKGNFALPNVILISTNLCLMALFYWNYKGGLNAGFLIHDYFVFHFLQGILVTIFFVGKYVYPIKFELPSKTEIPQILKFATVSLLANLIFYVVYKLDILFVKNWCSNAADLGNYAQANKLSQMLLVIPQIIATSILPVTASKNNHREIVDAIKKYTKWFGIAIVFLLTTMLVFGKSLVFLFFGESFNNTHYIIAILLPGIYCLMISTLLSAFLSGKNKNKYNLYAAIIAVATMLICTFLCKSIYSIFIAAAISSLAYFAESFYCFTKFCKLEKLWIYKEKSLITEA